MTGEPPFVRSVGILVVNYFSSDSVKNLLSSLARMPEAGHLHVSIVDNSCDRSEFAALSSCSDVGGIGSVQVTASAQNLGYAAGNNLAYEHLPIDVSHVFVINPDVQIVEGDLVEAVRAIAGDADAFFTASTAGIPNGITHSGSSALNKWTSATRPLRIGEAPGRGWVSYPDGHFVGMSARVWHDLGGLDTRYFLYCEEVDARLRSDLSTRIRRLPRFSVAHVGGLTTGSSHGGKSETTIYHAARSKVLLYRAHRRLRPYLASMIVARLVLSVLLLRRSAGLARASLAGLAAGLDGGAGSERRCSR
jgi:N-acetylglucosaminyl-diphospho-decaprenol L-rhamnosyltransferase